MKLLIIVLCLLSERYLQHAFARKRFQWFLAYGQQMEKWLSTYRFMTYSSVMLCLVVIPVIIVAALLLYVCSHVFYGIILFLLNLLIFYGCLGPQNAFYPSRQTASRENNQSEVSAYLATVNELLFAAVFWYIALGPLGVLLYRSIVMSKGLKFSKPAANELVNIMDWIPARMAAMFYLLVGNFKEGFVSYSQLFFAMPKKNHQLLGQCGWRAIGTIDNENAVLPEAERLVGHSVILLLVLLALLTLVAWA